VRWLVKPVQPFEAAGTAPLCWHLIVIIGMPCDPTNDPSIGWPAEREQVDVGTWTLDRVEEEEGSAAAGIVFDPLTLPAGMAPSDDPILRVRSPIYLESHARRAAETKQPSAITPADVKKGE
jgi:catalase